MSPQQLPSDDEKENILNSTIQFLHSRVYNAPASQCTTDIEEVGDMHVAPRLNTAKASRQNGINQLL